MFIGFLKEEFAKFLQSIPFGGSSGIPLSLGVDKAHNH